MTSCRDMNCRHYQVDEWNEPVRVCTARDVCPLELAMKPTSLSYRLQRVKESLAAVGDRDPGFIAYMMRDWPEMSMVGLDDAVWLLASEKHGCHKNDVIGLLETFIKLWEARS